MVAPAATPHTASPSAWDRTGGPWVWALAPFLFVALGFEGYAPTAFFVGLGGLWLPIAAWLGARHGLTGLKVVAVAGLPLLISLPVADTFRTVGDAGLYVAALAICHFAGQSSYRGACLGADRVPARSLAFLFLALPLVINLHLAGISFRTYLWWLLLVIGLSAMPLRPVVTGLCLATAGGAVLTALGATPMHLGSLQIAYGLFSPSHVVTGAVALWTGRLIRDRVWHGDSSPKVLLTLLGVLFLVTIGSGTYLAMQGIGNFPPGVPFGSDVAVALLLFACGVVGRGRGAIAAIAVWIVAREILFFGLLTPGNRLSGPVADMPLLYFISPGAFLHVGHTLGPRAYLAPLDLLFAALGWAMAARLGPLAGARPTSGEPAPPFRYAIADKILAGLAALFLAASAVAAILR